MDLDIEKIATALGGKWYWVEELLMVEKCPFCSERFTFRFLGNTGMWECTHCHIEMGEFPELEKHLRKDMRFRDRLSLLQAPKAPEGLIVVSQMSSDQQRKGLPTGFTTLDRELSGLGEDALTILTGKQGEGKSTFVSQVALGAINGGTPVCFYSGELSAKVFRHWIMSQAAGPKWLDEYVDEWGATRYLVDPYAEGRIASWLGNRLILYDNTIVKSSERNAIMERFRKAYKAYGCRLYVVDNLMTARYEQEVEQNYFRAQSNFVGELVDFCHNTGAHVILVAHPRKSTSGDPNDDVSGSGDITRRASNVMRVAKCTDEERMTLGCDAVVGITKNREHGNVGRVKFNFDKPSRRFVPVMGDFVDKYGWEENV